MENLNKKNDSEQKNDENTDKNYPEENKIQKPDYFAEVLRNL